MDNRILYQGAVLGGTVAALTDALPLLNIINCLCCLGIISGGVVAVLFYRKTAEPEYRDLNTPSTVQLGLMAGLFGAFISFGLQYIVFKIMGNWQIELLTNMFENLDEVPALWENLYEEIQKEEYQGFAGMAILIRSLIIFPVFSLIGALITKRFMGRKQESSGS
ncbi:MAG: DUF4199 family protein [Calditrichaceae bacterium]